MPSRRPLFQLVLTGVLAALIMTVPLLADQAAAAHRDGEVILKFKANANQLEKDLIRAELGGPKLRGFGRIKAELRRIEGMTVEEAVARYRNHPKIEYIEPNYILQAVEVPNDPSFSLLWGMENTGQTGGTAGADISATNAWDVFTGSDQVLIGVIDTGVDYLHPDLAANIWTNPGEIPGNLIDDDLNGYIDDVHGWDFINNDNDPMDDNGHGTHVSGTIGADGDNGVGVAGVNWSVSIMGLKFLSAGGSGSTDDAVAAIEYATMMGVRMTSNSWGGGGFSQALYDAIADANAAGILFIAAAGNSGSNTDVSPHYPSSYDLDNIVAVAATDHNDALAGFSSYGATTVDLAAPGVDIYSTFPGNSYGYADGTSMATPHVAGALGLVFGRFPAIGHLDAKNLLLNFVDPIPALSGVVLTGGRLNAFFPIADPDSIPPGAIVDLSVDDAGSNWLVAGWTAPGDDDYTGTPARYVVKYSTMPITALNFDAADTAPNPPDPGPVGTAESMTIGGLDFSTTYYVAVKALDEFGNASPISNVPTGMTLDAPDGDVAPALLVETLLTGATSTQGLTLSNLAPNSTLDFEIPVPELVTLPPLQAEFVDVPKGGIDTRTGDPVTLGSGGPDGFGYRWVDSDAPFGPAFAWEEISGSGTVALSTGDDTNVGPFPIGFPFSFYGVEYTEFRVCSNGFLSFTSTSTAYSNQPLPNASAPVNLVAPFWDDLDTQSGTVYYQTIGTRLIVQWDGVSHYGTGGPYTFQVILDADGTILYQYLSMATPDNSATVGLQDATGTDGLQVAFNTGYIHDGLAVRFQAIPQWMTTTPVAGTVPGLGSTAITVDFDASGLVGGVYEGNIHILSNDPVDQSLTVPVTLTVIGAPDIDLAPLAFDFGQVFLGATPSTTVLVNNPGTDVLTVTSISADDPVYSVDLTAFTVPPRSSQSVVLTFAPTVTGLYPATLTVLSDDPDQPSATVALQGEGVEPPSFDITPPSLTSNLLTGGTETQTLSLTNNGGADLTFDVSLDLGTTAVTQYEGMDFAKGETDPRPGILGSGGPDTFGYSWIDSDDPGGPVFDWTDISGVGTPMFTGNSDDGNQGPFPIGFDFSFYGNTFSTFRACANGFISFTSSSGDFSNGPLPGTGAPENLLAVFHDDMYVDADIPSQVYYHYDGTRLIVQFDNIRRLGQSDDAPPFYTMQAILYPNGSIVYQYLTVGTNTTSATIGIQNDARDDGLTVTYNSAYVHDGLAIRFASSPDWLTASPGSGVVPPGGTQLIDVTFNAADLFGGTYLGNVILDTNDPLASQVLVPATLNVTGAPDIDASTLAVDFGEVFVGYPDLDNLLILNLGTDDLNVSSITFDDPAFSLDASGAVPPFTVAPLGQALITIRFAPPGAGPFTATMTVNSNDGDEAAFPIALSGTGRLAPVGSVNPDSLHSDLFTGETELQSFTISNTGGSDLEFDIQAFSDLGVEEVIVSAALDHELEKGELDPRLGILGAGGPDAFGYTWADSDEPDGPVFNWIDISGIGTAVFGSTADDSNQGPFPIGFSFPLYGNTFTDFRVSSNGFVSFTSTLSDFSNDPLPSSFGPENLLAVFWDDLVVDLSIGGQVYYHNDGTRLIVQYDGVRKFGQSSGPYYTFQIQLLPNGTIFYQYLTLGTALTSATVGIQNDAKDVALQVAYNTAYLHDNLAVRIGLSPDWLSATPSSGIVPPGGSLDVSVLFNANGLFGGFYEGVIRVLNNDPVNGLLEVDATLQVTGVPLIGFSAGMLDFGDVYVGYPEQLVLTVLNEGTDLLSVASVTPGLADFSVTPSVFDLEPLESIDLTVTFDPGSAGMYGTEITFVSNSAGSPHIVHVIGVGVDPPVATLTPDPVVGAAMPGGQKVKPLTLCNEGGSDLEYTVSWTEQSTTTTVQAHGYQEVAKGQDVDGAAIPEDPRPGILGEGGPDTFGYTWIDSDEPGGPAYDWVDITGVGTPVGFTGYSDDGNVGPVPIGFDFPFYGNTFDELRVCSNGWLSFTSTQTVYSNQPLPNSASGVPENLLAVYWDDMVHDPSDGNEILYYNDGTRLIVEYFVRRIADFSLPYYRFQVILYPSGDIVYQYHTLDTNTTSVTIGIQNDLKDDGLTVVYNDPYVHEDLAILFSAAPGWLSVSPESGILGPGECIDLQVLMDASALDAGDYFGSVMVGSNDPANPVLDSDVVFHVGTVDAVDVDVDPNTLNLDSNGKWITAYVELPPPYDPEDVVLETVLLNMSVPADRMSIGDFNSNGIPDVMFKFDRSAVEDILDVGDAVEVTITGEILDTIYFVATDYIRVIRPQVMSPNGGETFAPETPVEITWVNPQGWSVDYATILYSPDDGETWTLVADNVIGESYTWAGASEVTDVGRIMVALNDNQGVMGYDCNDEPFFVGAILGAETPRPDVFALRQNAPNPFRHATRIAFDLPEDSHVRLSVYDANGRLVRTLRDTQIPAGTHAVSWDGRDRSGRSVASGIYFYKLTTDTTADTKRMFLLR